MKKKSSEHQIVMQSGDLEELEVSVYCLSSMYNISPSIKIAYLIKMFS
jgi:hypothetical protein